jgi:hypothetical protein
VTALAQGFAKPASNIFHNEIAYLARPLLMCPRTMSIIFVRLCWYRSLHARWEI